jgi:epoxyqueuosine reductase QueG
MKRAGEEGLRRNAALSLRDRVREPEIRRRLEEVAASDRSPTVRAAAVWALAAGGGAAERRN